MTDSTAASAWPKITYLRWWPLGEPIPDGWRITAQEFTHHHTFGVLLEKVKDESAE